MNPNKKYELDKQFADSEEVKIKFDYENQRIILRLKDYTGKRFKLNFEECTKSFFEYSEERIKQLDELSDGIFMTKKGNLMRYEICFADDSKLIIYCKKFFYEREGQ